MRNIERLHKIIVDYGKNQKLRSTAALHVVEMLANKNGEKVWPSPNDLSGLTAEQLGELRVCALLIIQKNSQRGRGEQWGHAFFLKLKLDQGIESPLIG